jgi:hypothetical protein
MKRPSIPDTDSIRELAEFWDTHDVADFEDYLEEVHEPVFERAGTPGVIIFGLVSVPIELMMPTRSNGEPRLVELAVESFVPADMLPPAELSNCVEVRADRGGEKAYSLLVQAMKAEDLRAIVEFWHQERVQGARFLLRLIDNAMVFERCSSAVLDTCAPGASDLRLGELDLARALVRQLSSGIYEQQRDLREKRLGQEGVVRLEDWIADRKTESTAHLERKKQRS